MLSTLNYETKQGDTNDGPHLSYLVQPNLHGKPQRLPSLKVLWIRIFSYSGPTEKETAPLRRSCKLFSKALKPLPYWTSFPHPKYPTLNQLVDRINEVAKKDPSRAPSVVFISNGVHVIEDTYGNGGQGWRYVKVRCALAFVGESREGTVVRGGFKIYGDKKNHVRLETMTVTNSYGHGVDGYGGASFEGKDLSIHGCKGNGVSACRTQGTLTDCTVTNCGGDGIYCDHDGVIHIHGKKTKVTGNCTMGNGYYGVHAWACDAKIFLHAPLTKEMISTNNHGGNNYRSSYGTIQTITNNNTKEEKK